MVSSHRVAVVLLLFASLLVAVALSGADARPAVRPGKTAAALSGADVRHTGDSTKLTTVRRDEHGPGYVAAAALLEDKLVKPECGDDDDDDDDDDDNDDDHEEKDPPKEDHPPKVHPKGNPKFPGHSKDPNDPDNPQQTGQSPPPSPNSEESELEQELCSTCEKPPPPPPCNTCEPKSEPELTCSKVHAVREGETCYSVGQCAGLGQDDFLRFNPNICCDNLFIGQWVCLDATCAA